MALDLTGLPPTPEEVRAFVDDTSPDAYERMVDRYLASPHYGERWGKYWLDAAGYADSNGYFNADTDRPLAWRYRDWVVRARMPTSRSTASSSNSWPATSCRATCPATTRRPK